MINLETAKTIVNLIEKECCRDSLADVCDYWEVSTEDFFEFLKTALDAIAKEQKDKKGDK